MGQVYQATDTKLNRQVALKILPEAFATDPDRLARFQREAQVLASLNHPGIAAIYGIEEADDTRALVLELVEGPTLADRIAQGPIPLDEALPIAKQIAEALEAAHEAGVIHRDLKPANVKVREDGAVKVLDLSDASTVMATREGVIQGTPSYMSPQQAVGEPVDKKADIWSFGCVLYELLTGVRPFRGDGTSDILSHVLKDDPDWGILPKRIHPGLRATLERCLRKDQRQRWHHMADVRVDLGTILSDPRGLEHEGDRAGSRIAARRTLLQTTAAALLVGSLITGLAVWRLLPPPGLGELTRFSYVLPEGQAFRNPGRPVVAVSRDGSQFVYNTTTGLYVRSLDALDARLIPGTENALTNPFFAPDGQSVGYYSMTERQLVVCRPVRPGQSSADRWRDAHRRGRHRAIARRSLEHLGEWTV